jgi:hypothetical protein
MPLKNKCGLNNRYYGPASLVAQSFKNQPINHILRKRNIKFNSDKNPLATLNPVNPA